MLTIRGFGAGCSAWLCFSDTSGRIKVGRKGIASCIAPGFGPPLAQIREMEERRSVKAFALDGFMDLFCDKK